MSVCWPAPSRITITGGRHRRNETVTSTCSLLKYNATKGDCHYRYFRPANAELCLGGLHGIQASLRGDCCRERAGTSRGCP